MVQPRLAEIVLMGWPFLLLGKAGVKRRLQSQLYRLFFGYLVARIILVPVNFTGSDDVLAVDRLQVVAHGNHMKAHP